jgi:hypothetical protein
MCYNNSVKIIRRVKFMKLRKLLSCAIALAMVLSLTVSTGALHSGEFPDFPAPVYDAYSGGWIVESFATAATDADGYTGSDGGRVQFFPADALAEHPIPDGGWDTLLLLPEGIGFLDVTGVRVEFFFDWDDTSWAGDQSDPDNDPWNGHSISVITQNDLASWEQHNFDVAQFRNNPAVNVEIVTMFDGGTWQMFANYLKVLVYSWGDTPGYAVGNLLDSNGNVIRLLCPDCGEDYCVCPCGDCGECEDCLYELILEDGGLGDVNLSGGIDIGDALEILKYLAGLESMIDEYYESEENADVNGDGAITIDDALEILKYLAGLPSAID